MRFILNLFPIARWILPLVVIFINLFPRPVMAGTVTTDYVSWESNIPNAPPVITTPLAGTGGATVSDPFTGLSGFSSVDMSAGSGMVYSSDGTMLCIEPDGTNLATVYFYLEALTDDMGFQMSGDGIVAFYDASRATVTEGFVVTGGFVGVNGVADSDLFFIQAATATDTVCVGPFYLIDDVDGDGYAGDIDCDEVDNDLDGSTACDDCDDTNATVYPGAVELEDGLDNNCSGIADEGTNAYDDDADGYTENAGDCDDANIVVFPGAVEVCNSTDDDCDGIIDEGTSCYDDDGDGYTEDDGDCDDTNPGMNPAASEVAYDGIDQDCSGADLDDVDGDGSSYPTDCNDANAAIYPGAAELCNSLDDNCDGNVDEGLDSSCYEVDGDGDGYTPEDGDCDDTNAAINPGASDIPDNGIDEDCSGEDLSDVDGDGYGRSEGDCDDTNAAINPGAAEVCDEVDQNCNGVVDDSPTDGSTWYRDADADTFGDDASELVACDQPATYVAVSGDCDDTNADINPGATDVPNNGIDEDCDGEDATTPGDTGDTGGETGTDTAEPIFDTGGVIKINGVGCGCNSGAYTGLGWLWLLPLLLMRRRV